MKKLNNYYKNHTPRQVQDDIWVKLFASIIITGLVMLGITVLQMKFGAIEVEGSYQHPLEEKNNQTSTPHDDDNLTNKKPTKWWRLNSNGFSQRYIHLESIGRDARAIELLDAYGFDGQDKRQMIKTIARIHKIQPEMFVCIMYADSSIGRFLKSANNPGNVFNNDRGDTKDFEYIEQGVDAIGRYALNGRYLKDKYTVDYLSPALGKPGPYYATSKENRHVNVMNCLGMIHDKHIEDNRHFRF